MRVAIKETGGTGLRRGVSSKIDIEICLEEKDVGDEQRGAEESQVHHISHHCTLELQPHAVINAHCT